MRSGMVLVGVVRWAFDRVEVEGDSMAPTFRAGDRLLLARRWRPLRVGDLVVLDDPRGGRRLVKRVAAVRGTEVEVRGDNDEGSTDSRQFGIVEAASISHLVLRRYASGGAS